MSRELSESERRLLDAARLAEEELHGSHDFRHAEVVRILRADWVRLRSQLDGAQSLMAEVAGGLSPTSDICRTLEDFKVLLLSAATRKD